MGAQFNKVTSMVDEALSKGAKLVSGGSKHHIGDLQYKPTILTEVTTDMSLIAEEVFGPVISIKKFETEEEALELANDSRVGLAGYFYSNDDPVLASGSQDGSGDGRHQRRHDELPGGSIWRGQRVGTWKRGIQVWD